MNKLLLAFSVFTCVAPFYALTRIPSPFLVDWDAFWQLLIVSLAALIAALLYRRMKVVSLFILYGASWTYPLIAAGVSVLIVLAFVRWFWGRVQREKRRSSELVERARHNRGAAIAGALRNRSTKINTEN